MEKQRAISLLDETLDRFNKVDPDALEEIADEISALFDSAKTEANRLKQLDIAESEDGELRESIVGELEFVESRGNEVVSELRKMADRLRA